MTTPERAGLELYVFDPSQGYHYERSPEAEAVIAAARNVAEVFSRFDGLVESITEPDPTNPTGPRQIVGHKLPIGWFTLRGSIKAAINELEALDRKHRGVT